jgi:hypothetical protein
MASPVQGSVRQYPTAAPLRERPHLSLWTDTMKRCHPNTPLNLQRRLSVAACLLLPLVATLAHAQMAPRKFPPNALRGTLVVAQPPNILLDGQPARLSPGSRIRGTNNMLVLSGNLVNQQVTVNYTLEAQGMVHDVWILTDAEAEEKRPTAADLRN